MSNLIKETETELFLERYIHSEPDEFSEWEMDEKYNKKYSQTIQEAEHYALFECLVSYKIDKQTGEVTILGIR